MANIYIFGPGGIGKMSTAQHLAESLGYRAINLNQIFAEKYGLINDYMSTHGNEKYYRDNSELFEELLARNPENTVWGLSYGFLVYEESPSIATKHIELTRNGRKFLVLPFGDHNDSYEYVNLKRSQSKFSKYDEEKEQFIDRADRYMKLVDYVIYYLGSPRKATELIKQKLGPLADDSISAVDYKLSL